MSELTAQTGKHLSFKLGKEEYAITITRVKEIIGMMDITNIPQSEEYIKGVINLRGNISPVIDLRLRLNLPATEYTERTCIIIVETSSDRGVKSVGLVVDSVSEVIFVEENQIDEVGGVGGHSGKNSITGLAKTDSGVKIILNVDQMVAGSEIVKYQKAA